MQHSFAIVLARLLFLISGLKCHRGMNDIKTFRPNTVHYIELPFSALFDDFLALFSRDPSRAVKYIYKVHASGRALVYVYFMPLMPRIRVPISTFAKTRCMARRTSPNYSVSHLSINSWRSVKNALQKIQSSSPTGAVVP